MTESTPVRYACEFMDDGGIRKTVHHVSLSEREVETVESLRSAKGGETADDAALNYALRSAYREMRKGRGFMHTAPPVLAREGVV